MLVFFLYAWIFCCVVWGVYAERSARRVRNGQSIRPVAACVDALLRFAVKQEGYFPKASKNCAEGALDEPLV